MTNPPTLEEKMLKGKKPRRLDKNVLNVMRTTMRNNIELTNIADNKANVLLSLNALMLTFLLPVIIPNFDFIQDKKLGIAIGLLVLTCLVTIYLSAIALMPGDFDKLGKEFKKGKFVSPFFFGNTHKMSIQEFEQYIEKSLAEEFLSPFLRPSERKEREFSL